MGQGYTEIKAQVSYKDRREARTCAINEKQGQYSNPGTQIRNASIPKGILTSVPKMDLEWNTEEWKGHIWMREKDKV